MPDSRPKSQIELIDFGSETPPARLSYAERVVHDGVSVSRCTLQPNSGTEIGATQFTVAINEGTPFQMEWRLPEMRETERRRIVSGDLHINPGDRPIFQRWSSSPRILVIAMEQGFVKQIVGEAFDGKELELRPRSASGIRSSRAWLRRGAGNWPNAARAGGSMRRGWDRRSPCMSFVPMAIGSAGRRR